MARILAPITDSSKVVIGGKYIELSVWLGASGMGLDAFTVVDGPHKDIEINQPFFNVRYHTLPWNNRRKWRHLEQRFLGDCGLDLGKKGDNHHRIFKDTRRNRRVLQEIVAKKNLEKYYEIIGVQKVAAAA